MAHPNLVRNHGEGTEYIWSLIDKEWDRLPTNLTSLLGQREGETLDRYLSRLHYILLSD